MCPVCDSSVGHVLWGGASMSGQARTYVCAELPPDFPPNPQAPRPTTDLECLAIPGVGLTRL